MKFRALDSRGAAPLVAQGYRRGRWHGDATFLKWSWASVGLCSIHLVASV